MRVDFLLAFDSETIPVENDVLIIHKPILASFVASDIRNFKQVNKHAKYFFDIQEFNRAVLQEILSARVRFHKENKNKTFNAVIVAHNTAFDDRATKLSIFLEKAGFSLEFEDYDNKFVKILYNKQLRTRIYIIDTMNFVKTKLKDVGEAIGIKKLEFDVVNIDLEKLNHDKKYKYALVKYNIVDSLIAFEFASMLIKFYKDAFSITASSSVLKLFKKEFPEAYNKLTTFSRALKYSANDKQLQNLKNEKIKMLAKDLQKHRDKILDLLVKSYRGGRVEVFERGTVKDVVVLDVNSMYPYVMSEFAYPVEYLVYIEKSPADDDRTFTNTVLKTITELKNNIKQQEDADILYILEADFIIKPLQINKKQKIAPVLVKRDQKLVPVVGFVHAVLTSSEIEAFPQHIKIINIDRVIIFKAEKVFKKFVEKYYDLKKNAPNSVIKQFAKLNLNSLYGKFGQRNEVKFTKQFSSLQELKKFAEKITDKNYADFIVQKVTSENFFSFIDEQTETRYTFFKFDEKDYRVTAKKLHEYDISIHSNIAIASFVTANARVHLTKLITEVAKYSEVFYCDTDSIHAHKKVLQEQNLQHLLDEKELGKLKNEEEADYGVYMTLKVYALLNYNKEKNKFEIVKIRAKGIPTKTITETFENEIDASSFTKCKNEQKEFVQASQIKQKCYYDLRKLFQPLKNISFEKFAGLREAMNRFKKYDNILILVHKEFSFEYDKAILLPESSKTDENNVLIVSQLTEPSEITDLLPDTQPPMNKDLFIPQSNPASISDPLL